MGWICSLNESRVDSAGAGATKPAGAAEDFAPVPKQPA
jgi:hypothetical protein